MRKIKIRGQNRLHKQIENWRVDNLSLDLTDNLLNQSERYYAKIRVHPWSGISLTNSVIPEPTGKTKQIMLKGLLDIYEEWKTQLDNIGQPYYLKVWLCEPRFSQSQVVCAIGQCLEFYENTFSKLDIEKELPFDNYGQMKTRLKNFNWEVRLDEDYYDNCEVGEPELYASQEDYEESKRWFAKLLKKPHRTEKLKEPIGERIECYLFKRGYVWLGSQN